MLGITEFAAGFLEAYFKPAVSGFMSLLMAVSPAMPENIGKTTELAAEALSKDPVHISVNYDIELHPEYINKLLDEPDSSEGSMDIYLDVQNGKMNVIFGEKDEYSIYMDSMYTVYSPEFAEDYLLHDSWHGELNDSQWEIYEKYYADKYMREITVGNVIDTADLYELPGLGAVYFDEFDISQKVLNSVESYMNDIFGIITAPGIVKSVNEYNKPVYELMEKYFYAEENDGRTTYGLYLDGMDYISFITDYNSIVGDETYTADMNAIKEKLISEFDAEKYAKEFFGEKRYEYYAEDIEFGYELWLDELFPTPDNAEVNSIQRFCNIILTGEEPELKDGEFPYFVLEALRARPYFENSYVDISFADNADGSIDGDFVIFVSDGEYTVADIKLDCTFRKYNGKIISASEVENTFAFDEIYYTWFVETVKKNGIIEAEYSWMHDSTVNDINSMNYGEPEIRYDDLYIYCFTEDMLKIISDPAYEKFSDETKSIIMDLFKLSSNYGGHYYWFDAGIKADNGEVYIPIEDFCKYTGLEISHNEGWAKATVTYNGNKTELSGKLFDNMLYVKLSDLEKTGVSVEYIQDDMYQGETWHRVIIRFPK